MRPILAALPAKAGQDVAVDVEFAHTSSEKVTCLFGLYNYTICDYTNTSVLNVAVWVLIAQYGKSLLTNQYNGMGSRFFVFHMPPKMMQVLVSLIQEVHKSRIIFSHIVFLHRRNEFDSTGTGQIPPKVPWCRATSSVRESSIWSLGRWTKEWSMELDRTESKDCWDGLEDLGRLWFSWDVM